MSHRLVDSGGIGSGTGAYESATEGRKGERTPLWEVFYARRRVGEEERKVFRSRVEAERAAARRASGIATTTELGRRGRAEIQRRSMRRALVARGYLTITKRRVPLTLNLLFEARIP